MSEAKKRKYTPAHNRATKKWESANIYKATCKFPKDWEEMIKLRASELTNGSVNAYIKYLVESDLWGGDIDEPTNETFYEAP